MFEAEADAADVAAAEALLLVSSSSVATRSSVGIVLRSW